MSKIIFALKDKRIQTYNVSVSVPSSIRMIQKKLILKEYKRCGYKKRSRSIKVILQIGMCKDKTFKYLTYKLLID